MHAHAELGKYRPIRSDKAIILDEYIILPRPNAFSIQNI